MRKNIQLLALRCTTIATFSMMLFVGFITSANAAPIRCYPLEKYFCERGAGCKTIPPLTWVVVDFTANTYSRCDRNGCDTYSVEVSKSGMFLVAVHVQSGSVIKISADHTKFIEVVTLGTSSYTSFGNCKSD